VNRDSLAPGEIRLQDVSRRFKIVHQRSSTLKETLIRRQRTETTEMWALRDVSLDIRAGEAVAIVGRNGSGKSTLLKLLSGIFEPHQGTLEVGGTVSSMLELGAGFHPDFTGRENVFMNGAIHGLSEREVRSRLTEIINFAGLEDFIDMPVRTYSSGMQMRLAFAVAAHVSPDVLLLDEVLAVGDEAFQRKCMGRIFEFRRGGGTLVFVSHDPNAVEHVCSRAILIEEGRILMDGKPPAVMERYHRLLAEAPDEVEILDYTESDDDVLQGGEQSPRGWGTMEAHVDEVRLVSAGSPVSRVVSGDAVQIQLTLSARHPIPTPNIGFSMTSGDGTLLYGTNTRMAEFAVDTISGTTQIAFDIPALALHEGEFDINVAVVSQDESTVYHWLDGATQLTVFAQGPGVGPAAIHGTWSLSSADTTAATSPGR